jgi:hypothetical protein
MPLFFSRGYSPYFNAKKRDLVLFKVPPFIMQRFNTL